MSKRAKKPIVKHWRLEFNQYDFVCCVAESVQEALDTVSANYQGMEEFVANPVQPGTRAKMIAKPSHGVMLLFSYHNLYGNILCHEVTHATNVFMEWMGIPLTDASDEAYAYFNDMLFRFVAQWWKEQGLVVPLTTPPVPELVYSCS